MITEAIALAAFGKTFADAWKASDIDDKALNTLRRAYDTHANAVTLFERRKQNADASLKKLVNRKRAIYTGRMKEFLDVYQQIHAIVFRPGRGIQELYTCSFSTEDAEELREMSITSMQQLPEKELVARYLFLGVGNSMIAESKRTAQIAYEQDRIADTMYAQAETLSIVMDAIAERANQFSALLAELGKRFGDYLDAAKEIIKRNGKDGEMYSEQEMSALTDCMNFADAIKKFLDIPILGKDGSVTEASMKALEDGKRTLQAFQRQI